MSFPIRPSKTDGSGILLEEKKDSGQAGMTELKVLNDF